jgi:hypothetical protein
MATGCLGEDHDHLVALIEERPLDYVDWETSQL